MIKRVAAAAIALVVLVAGGTWAYINVIKDDVPERLSLDAPASGGDQPDSAERADGVDGEWAVTDGSSPIGLGGAPAEGQQVTARATGDLTLRGTTRKVTFDVQAQRTGGGIRIAGAIPIVFDGWGIPNPSFGPAQTEDSGILEFLLVLGR